MVLWDHPLRNSRWFLFNLCHILYQLLQLHIEREKTFVSIQLCFNYTRVIGYDKLALMEYWTSSVFRSPLYLDLDWCEILNPDLNLFCSNCRSNFCSNFQFRTFAPILTSLFSWSSSSLSCPTRRVLWHVSRPEIKTKSVQAVLPGVIFIKAKRRRLKSKPG